MDPGKYVRLAPSNEEGDSEVVEQNRSDTESCESDVEIIEPDEHPTKPNDCLPNVGHDRVAVLEKAVVDLAQLLLDKPWDKSNTTRDANDEANTSWGGLTGHMMSSDQASTIRLEGIPSFPKDIPASGMWEAFDNFIEKFEIAITLNNITDPTRQAKILYLVIGDNLQTIVRAAGLRPSLGEPDCYRKMVKNISEYFHSMTDTAAEHEAFTKMKQANGESTMAFHARLMSKVQLCRYSSTDQARFVRTQLFNGMTDQKLADQARTFGLEAAYIVQAATRKEAFAGERNTNTLPESAVQLLSQPEKPVFQRSLQKGVRNFGRYNNQFSGNNQRRYTEQPSRYQNSPYKERNTPAGRPLLGKRGRCSRCDRPAHKGQECPALHQNCHKCGRRGHFAITCRQRETNAVEKEVLPKSEEENSQV
ncbi:uncharacterized protein LOC134214375 [Armigeres subalbatus]|uniref:uncharacterized protein LOC134214375 n=1 Tax=Armigeres subalbatus TaxID=124917 RepID=UPI002ED42064